MFERGQAVSDIELRLIGGAIGFLILIVCAWFGVRMQRDRRRDETDEAELAAMKRDYADDPVKAARDGGA